MYACVQVKWFIIIRVINFKSSLTLHYMKVKWIKGLEHYNLTELVAVFKGGSGQERWVFGSLKTSVWPACLILNSPASQPPFIWECLCSLSISLLIHLEGSLGSWCEVLLPLSCCEWAVWMQLWASLEMKGWMHSQTAAPKVLQSVYFPMKLLACPGASQWSKALHIGPASSEGPETLGKSSQATSQCNVHWEGMWITVSHCCKATCHI